MLFLYFFCFGFPLPHRHSVCWAENEELFFKKSFAVPFLSHLPRGALVLMMPGRSTPLNIRFLRGMGVYMRLEKNGEREGCGTSIVDTGDGFYVGNTCAYHTSCDAKKGSLLGTTMGAHLPHPKGRFFWGGYFFTPATSSTIYPTCSFVQFLEKRNAFVREIAGF